MAKILLVEDEPQMQRGVKDNLEFEGYEVDVAGDGKAGLEKLLANSYDLVLLDVMLPQMSGFDVCRKAREKGIADIAEGYVSKEAAARDYGSNE